MDEQEKEAFEEAKLADIDMGTFFVVSNPLLFVYSIINTYSQSL